MKFRRVDDHRKTLADEAFDQFGQDQQFKVFRRTEVEGDFFLIRIECLETGMALIDCLENPQYLAVHGGGFMSGAHAGAGTDEQLVLETGAQFPQAVAHG